MSNIENNKRIAKNTLILYVRLLLSMIISLYTSRVILNTLGVEDFGINNIVGGFVSMFVFFQSSLLNVTQRYLNISLGKKDIQEANHVFNQSLLLYFLISIIFYFISEIVGQWFIQNKLVIPIERMHAAKYVFQFSLFSVFLQINQISFISALIAREKMAMYAYLGILDVVIKLIIVFLLRAFPKTDHLILYSGLFCLSSFLIFICYFIYCTKILPECRIIYYWNKQLIQGMLSFISLNIIGCISWTIGYQGIDVILNMFFGPIVNAARGIAAQVNNALSNFTNNLVVAGNPQIIKSYIVGDLKNMLELVIRLSKFGFYIILILSLPILYETKYILTLWLKIVPEYTIAYTRLILIYSIINVISMPWMTVINATGKIKNINIYGRIFTLSCLPISYFLLKLGFSAITPMIILILVQILFVIYVIYDAQQLINFSLKDYIKTLILPLLIITLILNIFLILEVLFLSPSNLRFFIISGSTILLGFITIYKIGLSSSELSFLIISIKNRVLRY